MKLKNGSQLLFILLWGILILGLLHYPPCILHSEKSLIHIQKSMPFGFRGIGRDNEGRIWIGFEDAVYVYRSDGTCLFHLPVWNISSGTYYMKINNDTLNLYFIRQNKKYVYDFSGELLGIEVYSDQEMYQPGNSFSERCFIENDKIVLRYHSFAGYWWITDGAGSFLFGIPLFVWCMKLSFVSICTLILLKIRTKIRTGDGSKPLKKAAAQ